MLACLVSAALLAIGCRTEELAASPEPAPIQQGEGEPSEQSRVEEVQETPESDEPAERPARDIGAELDAAVAVPRGRLADPTRATPTTIGVSVSALVRPSGRPIQEPTSRPIQEPSSRPIQEPSSRKPRGPKPRPIDGWDVDESAKDWR